MGSISDGEGGRETNAAAARRPPTNARAALEAARGRHFFDGRQGGMVGAMRALAFRLTPGTDLKAELTRLTEAHALRAGFILTCVGSLARARLRMPGAASAAEVYRTFDEPMEIVSLTGTLSPDGPH